MAVLLANAQKQVEALLVSEGLISQTDLNKILGKSKVSGEPLLSLLVDEGHISQEDLTKITARVTKTPYVNLSNARVNPKILNLLPQEIAERYMAVPLGEMQGRLVVAMIDADNLQAVDFLSNRIGRPLKVFLASQQGIENVLKQYRIDVSKDVEEALSRNQASDQADALAHAGE